MKGNAQRFAKKREVLEIDLFLKVLRACRDEHALAAEDGGHEIRERLARAGARFDEQHATVCSVSATASAISRCAGRLSKSGSAGRAIPSRRRRRRRVERSGSDPRARGHNGNIRHSFRLPTFTMPSAASSSGVFSARAMSSPIRSISRSPMPRVVTAGVPMRIRSPPSAGSDRTGWRSCSR